MKRFGKFLRASLKMIYREKVALFWMFLFPLIIMLLLGTIFGRSGEANIELGVVNADHSLLSNQIVSTLKDISAFKVTEGNETDLKKKLSEGRLNAVLVLEKGFFDSIKGGAPGKATIIVDRSNVTTADITFSAVSQVMTKIVQKMARMPDLVALSEKPMTSSELKTVEIIVPGVLAMTLMTSGLLGLSLDFVSYREKGILRRIKVSPLPLSRFIGSELTAALIMALVQAVVLLGVGVLVFKVHVRGNPLYIAFLILLGAASFLALGFFISSLTRTLKTAQMAANAIAFPMMFLSGLFWPLSIMPSFLVVIAKCLPLYYLGHAFREVMVQGKGLGAVWLDILVVGGMGLIAFLASVKLFRWE